MDNKQTGIKPFLIIAVVVLLIANLWTSLSMKTEMNNLRSEVNNLRSQLSSEMGNVRQQISSTMSSFSDRLEAGESILTFAETTVTYDNGQLAVTVRFTPKEIAADETAYVTIADKRIAAKLNNDARYTATANIPLTKAVSPTISFESPQRVRQETLDAIDTDQTLSFEYIGDWGGRDTDGYTDGSFSVFFYPNYLGNRLYEDAVSVRLIIKSLDGSEVATVEMEPAPETQVPEMAQKFDNGAAYIAGLSEYRKLTGQYIVELELTTRSGLTFKAEVGSFENSGAGVGGHGSGNGEMTPIYD